MMELTTLKEIWKSPEWKKQSEEFKEGKPCAWCGAIPGDTYTDKKGKTRKLGFSVHHIEKHKWGLSLYNKVKNNLFKDYYKDIKSKPSFQHPVEMSKRAFANRTKFDWHHSHKDEIQTEFQKEKERIIKDYLNITDENVIVLCNKCHYATEKGLILCKKCKKAYHKPKYNQCFECRQNPFMRKSEWKKLEIEHPELFKKTLEDRLNEVSY